MAQTQRSLAELIALLPNNTSGLISPEDVRDMLVSLAPIHGSYSRLVTAPTTVSVAGDYVKAAGTTTPGTLHDLTMDQDNRLTFVGASPRHFHVLASISMTCDGINKVLGLKLAKNGVPLDFSVVRRSVGTGLDVGALSLQGDMTLVENDYVEVWLTNETSATDVTIEEIHLHAAGALE